MCLDTVPQVATSHCLLREFMKNNPYGSVVKPLHPSLPWATSYAINYSSQALKFRTMLHFDPNNIINSPSVITFAGHGYVGGHYLLPQYGLALAGYPGAMILHFSAQTEDDIGYHATSDTFFERYFMIYSLIYINITI